ncbi:hypothetical protein ACTQ54_12350, partial [Fundicoccus sp. Sow4_H7]|uniref:hypothetical protein n=1 Tax=Fundicoccus sp. Sow4_H7 TaxID=3438784 RepID=UPI003F8E4F45
IVLSGNLIIVEFTGFFILNNKKDVSEIYSPTSKIGEPKKRRPLSRLFYCITTHSTQSPSVF